MYDHFIYGLGPIIGHEVLKENLQTFEEACILTEKTLSFANLVGGCSIHGKFRLLESPHYTPMSLDSMGAW